MNADDILDMIGDAKGTYVWDAQNIRIGKIISNKKGMSIKKMWLIAAIIALMLLLVGCGVVVYHLILATEPWASMQQVEGIDVPKEDIQVSVKSVSPSDILIHCDITGLGAEEKTIVFLQQGPCTLEKRTESGWVELPRQIDDPEWSADRLWTDGYYDVSVNWSVAYGFLDEGSYRITTEVVEGQTAFTQEFEITEEMRTQGLETAEELVNRECYHVRYTGGDKYGSLDSVPEKYRQQFAPIEEDRGEWWYEYWKYGDDILHLTYENGEIWSGMLYKDGIKYKLERENDDVHSPIVGWMPWADLDLQRLTTWSTYFSDPQYEQNITYRSDGTIKQAVATSCRDAGVFDVKIYATYIIEFLDTPSENIARKIAEQNTNVYEKFSWQQDQQSYPALNVAFVNTESYPITTASEAIVRAESECTVEDTNIRVYRDETAGMWKVEYQIMYGKEGYQFIYMNDDGITQMISSVASKYE